MKGKIMTEYAKLRTIVVFHLNTLSDDIFHLNLTA